MKDSGLKRERDLIEDELDSLGQERAPLTAICLSGGGIRSAAFCLGVLQALARMKVLRKFDYLSTVSGGGYTGTWLESQLASRDPVAFEKELGDNTPSLVQELRGSASRYLTPRSGVWSLDTWRLLGTYARNLLLGWLVLVPFALAGVAFVTALPLLLTFGTGWPEAASDRAFVFVPPLVVAVLGLIVACAQAFSRETSTLADAGAAWLRRAALWFLVTGAVLYGPLMIEWIGSRVSAVLTLGSGALTAVASVLSDSGGRLLKTMGRLLQGTWALLTRLAAVVFVLAVVAFFAMLAEEIVGLTSQWSLDASLGYLAVAIVSLVVSAGFAWLIDANAYSLHGIYKDQLVAGFLDGKDRPLVDSAPEPDANERPLHVLNATLNTSHGFSADRMGLPYIFTARGHGYWTGPAEFVRHPDSSMTVGTAMAISGAAANPNMGYFSSALVRFPLALLNLRLGWWLASPTRARDSAFARTLRTWWIWQAEFFGIRDHGSNRLINVSDGGHFDNLGLYEMVRRKCRYILVVDAGRDKERTYRDLANAIRRIRSDFGYEITLNGLDLESWPEGGTRRAVYKGTIRYSPDDAEDDAELVYVRPEPEPQEPTDVTDYRRRNPDFPHESTTDQWFSEAQFESYRRLGQFTIENTMEYYQADKGPSVAGHPTSAQEAVARLAEAGYRMSRDVNLPTLAGGILYARRDDGVHILLVRSRQNTHWILPKGHIEKGESPRLAALREVEEETGYSDLKAVPFSIESFERDGERVYAAYFLMDITNESRARPGGEHRDCVTFRFGGPAVELSDEAVRSRASKVQGLDAGFEPADARAEWQQLPDDALRQLVERAAKDIAAQAV